MIPIFPGRFQPFHNGHLWIVERVIERHGRIVIAIVNPDPRHCQHPDYLSFTPIFSPFSFWDRLMQIRGALAAKDLWDYVTVIPLSHPRYYTSIERSSLPPERIWYIPPLDEHEIRKISDFQGNGETVAPIEVPEDWKGYRSTRIRNCIACSVECHDCYPEEIYKHIRGNNLQFHIMRYYNENPDMAAELLQQSCERVPQPAFKRRDTMRGEYNYLRAFGQAVAQAAGPVGAPLRFLLSLYDDERNAKRDGELKALLESGNTGSREVLTAIFDVKQGLEQNHETLVELASLVLNVVNDKSISAEAILDYPWRNQSQYLTSATSDKAWNTSQLAVELTRVFAQDTTMLRAIAHENGFPVELVRWDLPARAAVSDFVNQCSFQNVEVLSDVFSVLANMYPNVIILERISNLYAEAKLAKSRAIRC